MKYLEESESLMSSLPNGDQINLTQIEGWYNLLPEQHTYITHYVASVMQETSARIAAGVSKADLKAWNDDSDFKKVMEDIEALFTEGLAAIDYRESLSNPKIRGRVLAARQAKGYTKEKTQNNHLHIHGAGGIANLLKG